MSRSYGVARRAQSVRDPPLLDAADPLAVARARRDSPVESLRVLQHDVRAPGGLTHVTEQAEHINGVCDHRGRGRSGVSQAPLFRPQIRQVAGMRRSRGGEHLFDRDPV